ncbi:unnamed protein product, partial [Pleuronectes platessa]
TVIPIGCGDLATSIKGHRSAPSRPLSLSTAGPVCVSKCSVAAAGADTNCLLR